MYLGLGTSLAKYTRSDSSKLCCERPINGPVGRGARDQSAIGWIQCLHEILMVQTDVMYTCSLILSVALVDNSFGIHPSVFVFGDTSDANYCLQSQLEPSKQSVNRTCNLCKQPYNQCYMNWPSWQSNMTKIAYNMAKKIKQRLKRQEENLNNIPNGAISFEVLFTWQVGCQALSHRKWSILWKPRDKYKILVLDLTIR